MIGLFIRFSWIYLVLLGFKFVNLLYRKGVFIVWLEFVDEIIVFVDFGKFFFWFFCVLGNCVGWFVVLEMSLLEDNVIIGL